MLKVRIKRQLLFNLGCLCAWFLLVLVTSRGLLSPRGFAIAMAVLAVAIFIGQLLINRKSLKERRLSPAPLEAPADVATSKRRALGVKLGYILIVILVLLLANGLRQHAPLLPTLVGASVNLCITAGAVWIVMRLRKGLPPLPRGKR